MENRILAGRLEDVCLGLLVNSLDGFHKDPEDAVGLAVKIVNRDSAGIVWLPIIAGCAEWELEDLGIETYRVEVKLTKVEGNSVGSNI